MKELPRDLANIITTQCVFGQTRISESLRLIGLHFLSSGFGKDLRQPRTLFHAKELDYDGKSIFL